MRKISRMLMLLALVTTQQVFADTAATTTTTTTTVSGQGSEKPCAVIAEACLAAGFVKTESPDRAIWHDCMKPVILGQTVAGVKIDSATAKACRTDKIRELKMQLEEFKQAN